MRLKMLKVMMVLVLGFGLGACGKIPKNYRGTFVDQSTGFQVQLKSSEGLWIRSDGSQQVFPARAAAVKDMIQGQPGIYLRSVDDGQLEVFWVRPTVETRREEYGFVSFEGEVVYTRMAAKSSGGAVPVLLARYCDRGQILIDTVSQSFNGGCPGDSRILELVRVQPKK
jgi:hypothetical protein